MQTDLLFVFGYLFTVHGSRQSLIPRYFYQLERERMEEFVNERPERVKRKHEVLISALSVNE